MTTDPRVALILDTATRLIPGLQVIARTVQTQPPLIATLGATGGTVGIIRGRPDLSIFLNMSGVGRWVLDFARPELPMSEHEWEVLGRLPDAIATSFSTPERKRHRVAHQIASRLGLEHVLIAQTLRRARASGFWWPMVVLEALIDLTFRRYEGQQATTGIVFTSREDLYEKKLGPEHPYTLTRFSQPLELSYDLFAAPAAFRYVDGRNAFYLLNRKYRIVGVLRPKDPSRYSIIDRCSLRHVEPLVAGMPGRVWSAHVGFNSDVHVLRSDGVHLHWRQNHWRVRDYTLLHDLLIQHGCDLPTTRHLLDLFNTLSELRLGSVVLVPTDDAIRPPIVGKIDSSPIAGELRWQISLLSVEQLVRSHAAIGVLSSDGLTTISKTGEILSCGDILDLGGTSTSRVSGGGRSQAARAASEYGLAVKISEDGPITPFLSQTPVVAL